MACSGSERPRVGVEGFDWTLVGEERARRSEDKKELQVLAYSIPT